MTAEVNKLSDFGNQFQLKLIASLLTNKPFINRIHDIILKDYFESESNQFIIESIKKYYVKFKVQPSLDTLSIIASQYVSDEIVKVSI